MSSVLRHGKGLLAVFTIGVAACAQIAGIDGPAAPDPTDSAEPSEAGTVSVGDVEITTTPLDFGTVSCGVISSAQAITIHNKGSQPALYAVEIPDGTPFSIEGAGSGTVEPNGAATVSIVAKPTQARTSEVDLVVTAGKAFAQVRATITGGGPSLVFTPALGDFGQVRYQNGASIPIKLTNVGSAGVAIPAFTGTDDDFDVAWQGAPAALTVAAGQTASLTAIFKSASSVSAASQVEVRPSGVEGLCDELPTLTLKGERISTDLTISPADFGKQDCASSPSETRDIVLSNYSTSTVTWNAALPADTFFKFVNGTETGTIEPGSAAAPTLGKITLGLKPLGATLGPHEENVTVTISGLEAPDGGVRTAKARVDVRGAVVSLTPTSITDFKSNGDYTDRKDLTVTNTGNETIYLDWDFNRTEGDPAWYLYNFPYKLSAGATVKATVGFNPTGGGDSKGTQSCERASFTYGADNAATCAPLPSLFVHGHNTSHH